MSGSVCCATKCRVGGCCRCIPKLLTSVTPVQVAVTPDSSEDVSIWPGWTGVVDQTGMWNLPAQEQFIKGTSHHRFKPPKNTGQPELRTIHETGLRMEVVFTYSHGIIE